MDSPRTVADAGSIRILVIDEGSPGHLAQSRGLASAMAELCSGTVTVFSVRLAMRGVFRPWLRALTQMARNGLPECVLRFAYRYEGRSAELQADVIITSGGRGLCFAASLARRLGKPLVYCGDPSPYPAVWCDIILSPLAIAGHPRVILTELLLTEISPEQVAGCGEKWRDAARQSGGGKIVALLIGGDSRSHRYTDADWDALIDGMNRLGRQGWRWLVSTSRRTPVAVEARLRQGMNSDYLTRAVWWHEAPERVMRDFLGAADAVMVTQDSLTMLCEAVAAGKPAVALAPRQTRSSRFIETILDAQERQRRIRRLPIAGLGTASVHAGDFSPVEQAPQREYAATTLRILGLAKMQDTQWPDFGIIVPTYNRPQYLIEAISSVLAQTYPQWKLFICNDGSTEDYSEVMPWLQDSRIVMLHAGSNGGCNRARNLAIDAAMAAGVDYITLLDDEERLDPACLEVALQKIEAHPEVGWFISNNSGERKSSTRDIVEERCYDWIDDYVYGKALRGDKTHVIAARVLREIRFDGRFRASNMWPFFLRLAARTHIWGYTYPSKVMRYLDGGITKSNSRYPRTWLEIWSRFARHAFAIRLRPAKFKAYRGLLMEFFKTPRRIWHVCGIGLRRAFRGFAETRTRSG